MEMLAFLAGLASGLLAGVTVVVFSLAGHAWWIDRKASERPRHTKSVVIDGKWQVIQ